MLHLLFRTRIRNLNARVLNFVIESVPWPSRNATYISSYHYARISTCSFSQTSQFENLTRLSELQIVANKIHVGSSEGEILSSLINDDVCEAISLNHTLVDMLLRRFQDDWKSALGIFRWAPLRPHFDHLPETYDVMVDILGKARQFDKMCEFVHEMLERNLVTLSTMAKILRRYAGARRWKDVVRTFDELGTFGPEKNADSMNLLLDTLCKEKQVEMPKNGVDPNNCTFNTLIPMFCRHGRKEMAFNILEDMENAACKPDLQTFYPLLKACFKSGMPDSFLSKLLDDMVIRHHLSLDVSTYSLLIHGLCRVDKCEWAFHLFEEMIGKELTPRYQTCRRLLEDVKQKNMYDAAERVALYTKNLKASLKLFPGQQSKYYSLLIIFYSSATSIFCNP